LNAIEKTTREQLPEKAAAWAKATAPFLSEIDRVSSSLGIRLGGNRLEDAPKLAEDLTALYGQLSSAHSAPTAAQTTYLAELDQRYTLGIAEANGLLLKAGRDWNPALQKLGAPTLIAAEPVPAR
jgi:hypothetical protein